MKLLIEKKYLLEGLNAVSKALSTRNIIPVLNGIKFDLNKKGLYLTATDNDITIEYFIDKKQITQIEEEGVSIIYGKTMLEIVKRLPDTIIMIENFEGNEVSFKTETSIYNFNCYSKEDFPNTDLDKSKDPITLDTIKFKETINKTSFACSLQESRPLLTGINLKITGDLFECIATDSYRLAKQTYNIVRQSTDNLNIVIPARNINELVKILDDEKDLEMNIYSNKVIFRNNNITFQSSLLNGNYPNTDNSIAKEFEHTIKINLKEFYNILDRASILTQSKEKNIIDMEIQENKLYIRANSLEIGNVEEKMDIDNQTGKSIKISFSSKYMLEALRMFNKEEIYLLLNGEISPIILKNIEDDGLIQLILPMKTF